MVIADLCAWGTGGDLFDDLEQCLRHLHGVGGQHNSQKMRIHKKLLYVPEVPLEEPEVEKKAEECEKDDEKPTRHEMLHLVADSSQPTLSSQLENLTMSHLTKRHRHKRIQALEKMEDITLDLLWERREDPWW